LTAGLSDLSGDAGTGLASSGTNYLIVWKDLREGKTDIYAARLANDGEVLDLNGFAVCTTPFDQGGATVTYGDNTYLVLWRDHRSGDNDDIYAARVTPQGNLLDPDGIAVAAEPGNQWQPGIAFWGSHFLAVYEGPDPLRPANSVDRIQGVWVAFQPPSLVPTSVRWETNACKFTLRADPAFAYLIEVSTNLTDWTTLKTVAPFTSPMEVRDTNTAQAAQRFYRVKWVRE